eukprot:COSAG02_NODE_5612_length_4188_cov_45.782098_2_plen_64_part_00
MTAELTVCMVAPVALSTHHPASGCVRCGKDLWLLAQTKLAGRRAEREVFFRRNNGIMCRRVAF